MAEKNCMNPANNVGGTLPKICVNIAKLEEARNKILHASFLGDHGEDGDEWWLHSFRFD